MCTTARFRPWVCDSEAEDARQTLLIGEETPVPQLPSWIWCERRNIMGKAKDIRVLCRRQGLGVAFDI